MIDNNCVMPAPFPQEQMAIFYGSNVFEKHYAAAMVNSRKSRDSSGLARFLNLAKAADQFRAGDVTFWGVFALAVWAIALAGGGLSAMLPDGLLGGLHASRLDGGSLNQLRGIVVSLQNQTSDLRQQNAALEQRLSLTQQATQSVTQRLGALETTVPDLVETVNKSGGAAVDQGSITGSTGASPVKRFETDGGSVSYTQTPLQSVDLPASGQTQQAMPQTLVAPVTSNPSAFGIALGPPIAADQASTAWQTLSAHVGTMLMGLGPILGHVEGGSGRRLVVGPIALQADAQELCGRMAAVGVACATVPFVGDPVN
jgi:hypothetical protein